MKRKNEVIYLELQRHEIGTDYNDQEIILFGVRENSKRDYGNRPTLEIHIKCDRWTPEHLVDIAVEQIEYRKRELSKDIDSFNNSANQLTNELQHTRDQQQSE